MGDAATRIQGADLLNLLNYVNFREGTLAARFRDRATGRSFSVQAFPLPVQDAQLKCRWVPPGITAARLAGSDLEGLTISDGRVSAEVAATLAEADRDGATFALEGGALVKASRQIHRHESVGIRATLIQDALRFGGHLTDFNAVSFQLDILLPPGLGFHGVNSGEPVTILLERGGTLLYSGSCRIVRRRTSHGRGTFVVAPDFSALRRFPAKTIRGARVALDPAPEVHFVHPLTGEATSLPLSDLSGGGFAVVEFSENSLLLPGLVLPDLEIEVAGQPLVRTSGQILYRNPGADSGGRGTVRCGVAFLDLSLGDQSRVARVVHEALDPRVRIGSAADLTELWRFFFDSGFLYPTKYAGLEAFKDEFRKLYERLYRPECPVSRHVLFHDHGQLFAHLSMLRAYPEAWLIHHHAASRSGYGLAGVTVLDHAGQYLNEFHRHPSTHMKYVMCYYRPDNKFPHRVFGGAYRDHGDPRGISLDPFSYLSVSEELAFDPQGVRVLPASDADLRLFGDFYARRSGGLALEAMNLVPGRESENELNQAFFGLGIPRRSEVYALKVAGKLAAVVSVQLTGLGLNLSNLTNGVHLFVLDEDPCLVRPVLGAVRELVGQFSDEDLPLLVYPDGALAAAGVAQDKTYCLWTMELSHLDGYFRSLKGRFRGAVHV